MVSLYCDFSRFLQLTELSGTNHGGTEIYIADRLGSLVSYGISVPFLIFGDFKVLKIIFNYTLEA